jgi:hypothetical protein
MHSALYHGWLEHRRHQPREHAFRQRLFMVYLDLAELPQVFARRWLWSTTRRALACFDRRDHFGDPAEPLDESVRALVQQRTGRRPAGPIRLLTHLRYFGYCFNPVSFFYCFDATGGRVECIVAEVNNTPWGERYCYVLPAGESDPQVLAARSTKAMHVSPFNPMDLEYTWRFGAPRERLAVHMALHPAGGGTALFDAAMTLTRRPIRTGTLAATLLRFPFMTLQVIAGIHWQALRLWLKRVPVHTHPPGGREITG